MQGSKKPKGDVSLGEKEYVLTLEYFDDIIEQWDKACASDGDNQSGETPLRLLKIIKRSISFNTLRHWYKGIPMTTVIDSIWVYSFLMTKSTTNVCNTFNSLKGMLKLGLMPFFT